ncbi:unnamed protein product [Amaranthus hypochondriacus]
MEGRDQDLERTFRADFSKEGVTKLAERLTDRLKEYMGDFVDDTLVEYVIVLLGNGRSKEEVKEDLDVFLGDNSDSFVAWLWDHLASNLNHYIRSPQCCPIEVVKARPETVEPAIKDDSNQLVSESGKGKSSKALRSQHNRDWKGPITDDNQPLRNYVSNHTQNEKKTYPNALHGRQSISPEHLVHRKRNRPNEHPRPKRELSQATIAAPRRLLQFAVRDAVATTRPSNSVSEPVPKRLRSMVSSSTGNLIEEDNHKRTQSVSRVLNPVATAIRAVAEASRDVKRVRTRNVFDRLSCGDVSSAHVSVFKEPDAQNDDYDHIDEKKRQIYLQARDNGRHYNTIAPLMDSNTSLESNSVFDSEIYDGVNVASASGVDVSQIDTSNDSLMLHYSVAGNSNEITHKARKNEQELLNSASAKRKIVNISMNVNTWNPPHHRTTRKTPEVESPKLMQGIEAGANNSNPQVMKENNIPTTILENGKTDAVTHTKIQKTATSSFAGQFSTGHSLEEADSRTIFVNNVHFAATKDTLSRHFNKFGEVLKVIILTDAATGHPKGSAYVEFMRKEAADNALTLDGTSFMSRIVKVVKKSSVQPDTNSMMMWPRITRSIPFGVPRFVQASFPRVFPGAYRARPPIKLGGRSMQWKRDAQQTSTESATLISGNITTASRGLTYIRTDPKSDENPSGV